MIVSITISRGLFVFSQSCVKVYSSLTNVGSLAVGAFDLVNCSPSLVGFVSVLNVCQQASQHSRRFVGYTNVVGL